MTDILREICLGNYEPQIDFHPAGKKTDRLWEQAAEILGAETVNALLMSEHESNLEENLDMFREGFRLGALLMLELFYPASP